MTVRAARRLKNIRAVLSVTVGFLYTILFLEILVSVPVVVALLNGIQVFPAILKSSALTPLFLIPPAVILVLTVLFGRFYCSFLCPLGGLQDLFLFGIRKTVGPKKFLHQRPFVFLHFFVLAAAIAGLLLGNVMVLTLFEPFSVFGRVMTDLVRQGMDSAVNGMAALLQAAGIFSISRVSRVPAGVAAMVAAFLGLAGLFLLTFISGRKFCNTLCPTGAVLRLLSRFSIFRIRFVADKCVSCGDCEAVCRAGCIDGKSKTVDPARCVLCFDCLAACHYSAVRYAPGAGMANPAGQQEDRRNFLRKTAAAFLSFPFIPGALHAVSAGKIPSAGRSPVLPPGSLSLKDYLGKCIACHQCVSSCPNRIIRPALFEFGLAGLFQPVLDFRLHYCGFECNTCTQVCPTGAIRPLSLKEKQLTRIGQARLFREKCIVYDKKMECGACAEHCPNKAVHLVPWKGLRAPVTNGELCIGCGACEYVCPVLPKAIIVEGLAVQERAKPRKDPKIERKKIKADFPF